MLFAIIGRICIRCLTCGLVCLHGGSLLNAFGNGFDGLDLLIEVGKLFWL